MSHVSRNDGRASATSLSLLGRLKQDDPQAWDRLISLYAPLVAHWCRQSDVPAQDVADIVQDVFQSVARKIEDFRSDPQRGTFRGWLRTITRNKIHDHFRKLGREPATARGGTEANLRLTQLPMPSDEVPEPAQPTAEQKVFARGLQMIRGHFASHTWQAFMRTVVDGATPKDVAGELQMTPGAVRVAKSRVLHRLRQELGDLLD